MVPGKKDVRCIDTTGAGDSFVAGFIFELSEGWTIREVPSMGMIKER